MRRAAWAGSVVPVVSLTAMTFLGAAACGSGGKSSTEIVTEPVDHIEVNNALASADFGPSAIGYVLDSAAVLDLGLFDRRRLRRGVADARPPGCATSGCSRRYLGVPVYSSILVAHADDTTFLGFNGDLTRNLDGFDVTPSVTRDEALAIAPRPTTRAAPPVEYTDETTAGSSSCPASDGRAPPGLAGRVPQRPRRRSASRPCGTTSSTRASGAVIEEVRRPRDRIEQASGRGGNAKRARSWTSELDVEEDGGPSSRWTPTGFETARPRRTATRWSTAPTRTTCRTRGQRRPRLRRGHPRHDEELDGARLARRQRASRSRAASTTPTPARARPTTPAGRSNEDGTTATAAPSLLPAEPARSTSWPTSSTTASPSSTPALEYKDQSGGLNESFSDVAGTVAEFYRGGGGRRLPHRRGHLSTGEALRCMCDPGKDGRSIGRRERLQRRDGRRTTRAASPTGPSAWRSAATRRSTGDPRPRARSAQVGQIWYAANAAYWTSGTDLRSRPAAAPSTPPAPRLLERRRPGAGRLVGRRRRRVRERHHRLQQRRHLRRRRAARPAPAARTTAAPAPRTAASGRRPSARSASATAASATPTPAAATASATATRPTRPAPRTAAAPPSTASRWRPFGCCCDDACEDVGDCCADRGDVCM